MAIFFLPTVLFALLLALTLSTPLTSFPVTIHEPISHLTTSRREPSVISVSLPSKLLHMVTPTTFPCSKGDSMCLAKALLNVTNEYRVSAGEKSLLFNCRLYKFALRHSKKLAAMGGLQHTSGEYRKSNSIRAENIAWREEGGNIVAGTIPSKLLDQWWKSPGHHDNILMENESAGMAAFVIGSRFYGTQMFGPMQGGDDSCMKGGNNKQPAATGEKPKETDPQPPEETSPQPTSPFTQVPDNPDMQAPPPAPQSSEESPMGQPEQTSIPRGPKDPDCKNNKDVVKVCFDRLPLCLRMTKETALKVKKEVETYGVVPKRSRHTYL